MQYAEQLKDPRWQKKRLSILKRDQFTCQECDAKEKTLHVHHMKYEFGKNIFDISDEHLVTLCEECHADITQINRDLKSFIDEIKHMTGEKQSAVSEVLRCITNYFPTYMELLSVSWLLEHRSRVDIIKLVEEVRYGKTK